MVNEREHLLKFTSFEHFDFNRDQISRHCGRKNDRKYIFFEKHFRAILLHLLLLNLMEKRGKYYLRNGVRSQITMQNNLVRKAHSTYEKSCTPDGKMLYVSLFFRFSGDE